MSIRKMRERIMIIFIDLRQQKYNYLSYLVIEIITMEHSGCTMEHSGCTMEHSVVRCITELIHTNNNNKTLWNIV